MNLKSLQPCAEISLSKEELEDVVDKARDWALMHGVGKRPKGKFSKSQLEIIPFTLLPSSFPRSEFNKTKSIQTLLNELVHKVAHDYEFLKDSLKSTIKADSFTAKLFNIYDIVYKEGFTQKISLGLFRSDYMLHNYSVSKQVEFNTIAISFSGLASALTKFHRYMLSELGHQDKLKNIPNNNSLSGFSNGLVQAWNLYGSKKAVILFVVEDLTYNICDQRHLEFEVQQQNPDVKMIRRSLTNLSKEAKLGPDKELIVENKLVAVVYFRTGYEVEAYPTEDEWSVRLLIERSKAIKCPSIQYHLAGTKKIQQALASPGVLNMFLKDKDDIAKVQEVFAGLYSLEFDDNGEKAIKIGIEEPENFVLKPQREGGGHNVYGKNVGEVLKSIKDSEERAAWILMELIKPSVQKNYIICSQEMEGEHVCISNVLTELGVYGVILGDHNEIMLNQEVGHILRTKPSNSDEGGVVAGFGSLDSPYLI